MSTHMPGSQPFLASLNDFALAKSATISIRVKLASDWLIPAEICWPTFHGSRGGNPYNEDVLFWQVIEGFLLVLVM